MRCQCGAAAEDEAGGDLRHQAEIDLMAMTSDNIHAARFIDLFAGASTPAAASLQFDIDRVVTSYGARSPTAILCPPP